MLSPSSTEYCSIHPVFSSILSLVQYIILHRDKEFSFLCKEQNCNSSPKYMLLFTATLLTIFFANENQQNLLSTFTFRLMECEYNLNKCLSFSIQF